MDLNEEKIDLSNAPTPQCSDNAFLAESVEALRRNAEDRF